MRLILVVLFIALFLVLSIPLMIAEWIIGKFNQGVKDRSSLAIVQWAFRCIIFIAGIDVTVIGKENIPKDEPVLYIGNHRSVFDTVVTYARVPALCGYIAKKELKRVPLLGVWMNYLHCLFLDRSDIKKGLATILTAINKVKSGISICIFPEGTRSRVPDEFLPFKGGSLKIAEKTGCAIVPMVLNNTENIWETHLPWVRKTHVVLEYCKPIYPNDLSKEERKGMTEMLENLIKEKYFQNKSLV